MTHLVQGGFCQAGFVVLLHSDFNARLFAPSFEDLRRLTAADDLIFNVEIIDAPTVVLVLLHLFNEICRSLVCPLLGQLPYTNRNNSP